MINTVELSKNAKRDLTRVPVYIAQALYEWIDLVEENGLEEARKCRGYHDELCKGKRLGQHSIRLSKAYRAFYRIINDIIEYISVEEVNKHDY
ncbi:MAG: type II toxin-antitoxin system RelE/ParE family toxin [Candidatus Aureabacteria bacterium]|nr:type II toxin-antitoxin system RelE/ParE family toxin [Candidatus Auribacterota bacterium]